MKSRSTVMTMASVLARVARDVAFHVLNVLVLLDAPGVGDCTRALFTALLHQDHFARVLSLFILSNVPKRLLLVCLGSCT